MQGECIKILPNHISAQDTETSYKLKEILVTETRKLYTLDGN